MSHRSWPRWCLGLLLILALVAGCVPKLAEMPTPEPITLRFAYRQNTVELQSLFDRFHERYPWITIEPVETDRFGNAGMDTLLRASTVDIFRDSRDALQYAAEGMLKSLDDIQLGDWASIRDDYYKGAWEGLAIGGQQWGIPAGLDMLVTYINMDQARALAARVPDAQWTLLDFMELTTALNYPEGLPNADAKLFGFCTTPQGVDAIVFTYLHGGRIVDDINAPSEPTLDDPRTVEAVQWYADLYTRHGLAPDPEVIRTTFRRGGVFEAAMRGACGVWFGWYSDRGGLDDRFEWSFKWRMLPLPRDQAPFNLGDVEGYYITKDCAHPKEALKLLRFLSDHLEAAGKKLPPRKSLVESDAYEDLVGEEVATIARSFGESRVQMIPATSMPALETVGGAFFQAVQQIITEDLDAADVLAEAQQQVRSAFKEAP
ncbi:MAG: extracellular solute-binding protein [Chloroflexi bacterium]|nr:extracellular solute-binding protein [Chloroflexota bacterium]